MDGTRVSLRKNSFCPLGGGGRYLAAALSATHSFPEKLIFPSFIVKTAKNRDSEFTVPFSGLTKNRTVSAEIEDFYEKSLTKIAFFSLFLVFEKEKV